MNFIESIRPWPLGLALETGVEVVEKRHYVESFAAILGSEFIASIQRTRADGHFVQAGTTPAWT